MNYGTLPKTGMTTVGIGVGSAAFDAPLPLVIAAAGVGLVLLGAAAVRLGFRRDKAAGEA